MSFQYLDTEEKFLAARSAGLSAAGLVLTAGHNFFKYKQILNEERPGQPIGRPFDPELHEFGPDNGLWIIARNLEGKLMHTQALRIIDTKGATLADHLVRHFGDFPPAGVPLDWSRCMYRPGPGAGRMRGRIAYHGEFWIEQSELRGAGVSSLLSRCGFWEAMKRWDVDHIFAFMAKAVAFKGLVERAGWMHTDPAALRWAIEGRNEPVEGFMAYLDRSDLQYLFGLPIPSLKQLGLAA